MATEEKRETRRTQEREREREEAAVEKRRVDGTLPEWGWKGLGFNVS